MQGKYNYSTNLNHFGSRKFIMIFLASSGTFLKPLGHFFHSWTVFSWPCVDSEGSAGWVPQFRGDWATECTSHAGQDKSWGC